MFTRLFSVTRFAAYLAWVDIRNSFLRTRLGTLINAFGLFALIAVLSLFFGAILKRDLHGYDNYPQFLAGGFLVWAFLSATVNETCASVFVWKKTLLFAPAPFIAYPLGTTLKHFVIFLQNILIALILHLFLFGVPRLDPLATLAGLVLLFGNVLWLSILAAIASLRFRDLPQTVSVILYIGFFLTPILWPEHFLGRFRFLIDFNPFHHLVAVFRGPLLEGGAEALSWFVALAMLATGIAITTAVYGRVRDRLPYWV